MAEKTPHTLSSSSYLQPGSVPVFVMGTVHMKNIQTHSHDFYEFVFVERGYAIHNTPCGISVLLPGDAILIPPGETHAYFNVHAQKIYNCLFNSSVLSGFEEYLPCPAEKFLSMFYRKIHIGMDGRQEIYQLLSNMKDESQMHQPAWGIKVKAEFLELLVLAYRCHLQQKEATAGQDAAEECSSEPASSSSGGTGGPLPAGCSAESYDPCGIPEVCQAEDDPCQPGRPGGEDRAGPSGRSGEPVPSARSGEPLAYGYMSTSTVMTAIEFMQREYPNSINMQRVAAVCGVTPDYLAKLFRKACGITPSDFLASLRISAAMDLLLNTKTAVSDIAMQVGYEDAAYFSRIFKKTVGKSPMSYRTGITDLGTK